MTMDGRPTPAAQRVVVSSKPRLGIWGFVIGALAFVMAPVALMTFGSGLAAGSPLLIALGGLIGLFVIASAVTLVAHFFSSATLPVFEQIIGWRQPVLEFSQWPLELGAPVDVAYSRAPLQRKMPVNKSIHVGHNLTCTERVQYSRGTDVIREETVVARLETIAEASLINGVVESIAHFVVPTDAGAPPLNLANNQIDWNVESFLLISDSIGDSQSATPRKSLVSNVEVPVIAILDRNSFVGEGNHGAMQ